MPRCFVSPDAWDDRDLRLSPEEEHHLLDVLRAVPGDLVTLMDGQGREAKARLTAAGAGRGASRRVVLEVVEKVRTVQPAVRLTLMQALPKGQRMDWIVEKATELGVSEILPVMTEHVVTRLREEQKKARQERWQRIAQSAAKQCRTHWAPEVRPVCAFPEALAVCAKADLFLVGALTPEARGLRTVLVEAAKKSRPRSLALLIGPEGDLSPAELAEACRAGAAPVSFGPWVLRVDTAALFGLSVLVSEFPTRESGV